MDSIIQIKNLKKYFKTTKAVDDVSFEVKKGEILGFLGPNGAGKTTTIRCIMNFIKPLEGEIKVFGKDSQKDSEEIKKDIGFLPGEVKLYKNWTGRELIGFVQKVRAKDKFNRKLIKIFDFDPSKRVKQLSSGNLQKLGLLLALLHDPKLYILDEPTTALDPLLQNKLYEILKDEAKKGKTVFFSSHNLAEVEKICDRVCIIKKGRLIAIESIRDLKAKRLYTVHVKFNGDEPKKEDFNSGVQSFKKLNGDIILKVAGDINPVLKVLNHYELKDLEIAHATLEEMFIKYYK